MKENALDVLMYLFKNYIDGELEYVPDRESLHVELQEAGFEHTEINSAFNWLDGLANGEPLSDLRSPKTGSIRLYNATEMSLLDTECRGFLIYLENAGILSAEVREIIIDRALALDDTEIDIEKLKWVTIMVLFNQPEQSNHYNWLEDLVFDRTRHTLH